MIKKLLFLVFTLSFIGFSSDLKAQDPAYSQFFASPVYLNPALAGSNVCPRISLNHRNQWPGIGNSYVTYSATYDQFVDKLNGGIGVGITKDVAGEGNLNTTQINLDYAYRIKVSKKFEVSVALEGAYRQLGVDWNELTFSDQIDPQLGFVLPTDEQIGQYATNKGFADFSTGFMAFGSANNNLDYYFGIAAHHITQPDQGLISVSKLPMKITANIGASFPLNQYGTYRTNSGNRSKKAAIISPNILFLQQQDFMQINYGMYITKGPIVGGLWARQSSENFDAFIILIGMEQANWKFGYSYDVTVSTLGNVNTRGSHELSFAYKLPCRIRGKSYSTINCPNF
jgi:type IX secretion system PorP/SprF family membrane protein